MAKTTSIEERQKAEGLKIRAAARYARILIHAGDGENLWESLITNEWEIPETPGRYLALEFTHNGIGDKTYLNGMTAETMKELIADLNCSDTDRDDVDVFDLDKEDAEDCQIPILNQITGWFDGPKLVEVIPGRPDLKDIRDACAKLREAFDGDSNDDEHDAAFELVELVEGFIEGK